MHQQKRIALINDITGFGRCATMVMAPLISAMKIQTVMIPTAILSANTLFKGYYFDDYTSKMTDYIKTYKDLDLEFDGIATGFIGSEKQVDIVIDFLKFFKKKDTFVLVDPVMGDHGKIYATYNTHMCERMRELIPYADVMTPNLTELVTLLNIPYPTHTPSREELYQMCQELSLQGPSHIVVTGISLNEEEILNYVFSKDQSDHMIIVKRIGEDRCGTGDVIAALIAGYYMKGYPIDQCVRKATDFASRCIQYSEEISLPHHYGLPFEEYLYELGKD